MTAPDAALVARFRADLERLTGPLGDRRLALAVSGGPDSMALLVLTAAAFPGQVIAATVDHGLRPESADEAQMVAEHCAEIGVPHTSPAIGEPRPAAGNLHAWAREHRYALLLHHARDAGCAALLTAHHADDQAETFLMRAARGSGIAGLAGVREIVTGDPPILRPLLGWRSAALRAVVLRANVPFVDDPSNTDDRFERARVRAALKGLEWLDPAGLAAAARHAGEADAALAEIAEAVWARRIASGDAVAVDITAQPRDIRRRLARLAILGFNPLAGDNIEHFLDALESGRATEHGGVLATPKGQIWHFREAPPRRSH